jgi:hypothetical protein
LEALGFLHGKHDENADTDSSLGFHHGTPIPDLTFLPVLAPPIAVPSFLFGFGGRSFVFRVLGVWAYGYSGVFVWILRHLIRLKRIYNF